MRDSIQQALDFMPCRLCLGKFGQHAWQACPAACIECGGYGHTLGPNHPAGHIDSHQHLYHDVLKDSVCTVCSGSGVAPRFQQEIIVYRHQLEELLRNKTMPPAT
jgi:hypothetical protein